MSGTSKLGDAVLKTNLAWMLGSQDISSLLEHHLDQFIILSSLFIALFNLINSKGFPFFGG